MVTVTQLAITVLLLIAVLPHAYGQGKGNSGGSSDAEATIPDSAGQTEMKNEHNDLRNSAGASNMGDLVRQAFKHINFKYFLQGEQFGICWFKNVQLIGLLLVKL